MLFKVWMEEDFGDSGNRIGVVEADTLVHAAAQLDRYVQEHIYGETFTIVEGPAFTASPRRVRYLVRDTREDPGSDWSQGQDVYRLVPLEGPVLTFLAEDWKLVFS